LFFCALSALRFVILSEQRAFRAGFGEARCESKDLLFCADMLSDVFDALSCVTREPDRQQFLVSDLISAT
jgi:hypothetical protein